MDPADYDLLPPDDLDSCDHCGGCGVEPSPSWDPQDIEPCLVCHGNGVLPDYRGAA
jgi:hypothetical protein